MYKYAVPYRIHRRCTSTLYPLESTADASSLQHGNLESTCAISIQNKNNTLGTNPSVVSRILVLFYLPLALHIRSQQKQARENARNGNAFVNATRRKNILNAGRQTLAHNLSLTLAWEPSASILSGGNMSLAWIEGSRINAKYVGNLRCKLVLFAITLFPLHCYILYIPNPCFTASFLSGILCLILKLNTDTISAIRRRW